MPAKFHLSSSLQQNVLSLKLQGDFDGNAACQLIRKIEEDVSGASKIRIGTSELRHIHPFGRTVFHNRIGLISRKLYGLIFVGKHKHQFEPRTDLKNC